MRGLCLTSVACAAMLLASGAAFADGFKLKPGKWEFTTTTKAPMMAEPQTKTDTRCITEKESDPLGQMTKSDRCKVTHRTETADSLKWEMECTEKGSPTMKANGKLTAKGDTVKGTMEMTMPVAGHELNLGTTWKGTRLGDCD
jgi:hypothetical protein